MVNEKYSYKSFKRKQFIGIDPKEFNDTEIIGSCFYQNDPYSDVFPVNITKVIFTKCNLDNCNIPAGATVNGGTNKHYKVMNDQEYWLVNKQLQPITPRDPHLFDKCSLSKNPVDIPSIPMTEPITTKYDPVLIKQAKIRSIVDDPVRLEAALIKAGALNGSK